MRIAGCHLQIMSDQDYENGRNIAAAVGIGRIPPNSSSLIPNSAIRILQSIIPQSTIHNPQSIISHCCSCLCLVLLMFLAFMAGCAKTGEPQPPLHLVPKPSTDLMARQYGDQVVLTVTMPTENTIGTPATTLKRIELFRRADTDRQHEVPLQVQEFMQGAVRVLSVEQDKFSEYLHDKILVFRDELRSPDRSFIYRQAFRYSVVFVNKKGQTAGLGNQAFIAPVAIPLPPNDFSGQATEDSIRIHWTAPIANMDGSKPPRIAGYNVYRSEDRQKFPPAPLNPQPLQALQYDDRSFLFDKVYYYALSVVGSRENPFAESNASALLEVPTRDTFPPGAPPHLDSLLESGVVIILWTAPAATDIAGYKIYRKEEGTADRQLLQKDLQKSLSYRDASVQSGKKYLYEVTAIDTHGNEGPAAAAKIAVP
jgi:hypothetical protein